MKCQTNRGSNGVFEELERGFQELVRGIPNGNLLGSDDPRLTVMEFDDRYVVECDVPGVSSEELSLQVEDDVLCIRGKRQSVVAGEGAKVIFSERTGRDFVRKVRMAKHVDCTAIDAELKQGVLSVTIPKRAEVLPQRIQIRSGQISSGE